MQGISKSELICNYIEKSYDLKTPIFVHDFYEAFPMLSQSTIRTVFKRLLEAQRLEKIADGIYARVNQNSVLKKATVFTTDIIRIKYLNDEGEVFGYLSGINFANMLGLTTQVASVETICSNKTSYNKREVQIKNRRIILVSPRVEITKENYKLLQVLDLLSDFDLYSEYELKEAAPKILKFLKNINIDEKNLDDILARYPLETQVKFYKIGAQYVVTSTKRVFRE